jgi:lambda family phage portal protein
MLLNEFGQRIPPSMTPQQKALGVMRASARAELAGAYDAAQTTGENQKHWRYADDLSAAAANSFQVRKTLRQRARYECLQSNSFGNGIVMTLANDTISTGPILQVQLDPTVSKVIEQRWKRWCRATKLVQKLRTARLSKIVDGETFLLRTTNPALRDACKLDINLVEADQVSTPGWMEGRPGMVDGIIFDRYNNPTVYHVLKQHPGEIWNIGAWQKVDVMADDVIHLFNAIRPGQARGVPEVTPSLPLFAFLRRYTLATIDAAETAANLSAIITTQANPWNSEGYSTDPGIQPFDSVQIDRGLMVSLPHGYDMKQFKPEQPTGSYEGFRNAILQEIARCVHMPENKALGSSANYNFSSAKLDDQIYWHSIQLERELIWINECMERIFEWWYEEAMNIDGYLPLVDSYEPPHTWGWPPRLQANPAEEAQTNLQLINGGLKLDEQYLNEQGIDPTWFFRKMDEQIERRKRWGTVSQETATVMQSETKAQPEAGPEAVANQSSGEYMGISRMQWNRNKKAILETLQNVADGTLNRAQAEVFLSGVGLSPENIAKLLEDASDGSVDSVSEEDE